MIMAGVCGGVCLRIERLNVINFFRSLCNSFERAQRSNYLKVDV